MYVAVKGGEAAIANAHSLLADRRRGDRSVPALRLDQIVEQLALGVDRVMSEGSLYDRELAALAIVQARGDMIEAIFLVRAYRTTLPRFGYTKPIDTGAMLVERRVSATYKDLPGGQLLGPTFDYTHRLLDPELAAGADVAEPLQRETEAQAMPRVSAILAREGLIEPDGEMPGDHVPGDITREPLEFPMARDIRLQALSRGDEGFLLALGFFVTPALLGGAGSITLSMLIDGFVSDRLDWPLAAAASVLLLAAALVVVAVAARFVPVGAIARVHR